MMGRKQMYFQLVLFYISRSLVSYLGTMPRKMMEFMEKLKEI
jgi:hypothetical protein